MVTNVKSYCLP